MCNIEEMKSQFLYKGTVLVAVVAAMIVRWSGSANLALVKGIFLVGSKKD